MNQDEQVYKALQDRGGIELSKVSFYHAWREGKPDVMLEVHDYGESTSSRFTVIVRERPVDEWDKALVEKRPGHRVATGNPQATLRDALEGVHWYDVDMADLIERPD